MITAATIELVKSRTDIVAIVGETVKLTRRGRSWVGLCPFHKEKSPSFHVTPERGFFHCFGCKESGNAISFVMKVEGLSFPEAVRRLAERSGIEVEDDATVGDRQRAEAQRKARDDLYGVMNVAATFYVEQLTAHESARVAQEEIERRGLVPTSPTDTIATALSAFRIGYAPPEWDGLTQHMKRHGISPAMCEQVGLLVPRQGGGGHYDRFRNRLMFAVVDLQGRVVAFSGRILPDPKTGITEKETGKYVNSPETAIYRKGETVFGLFQARQAIRDAEEAVVVEGNFDVVSLHARGIGNVVAPLGTAFTPEQALLLKRFSPTVVLLFDADDAGRKAVRRAMDPCRQAGLVAKAAVLPEGKDPDELAKTRGPDAVRAVIKAADGLLEHLIRRSLDEGFSRGDATERAARAKEVTDLLTSESDPTVRALAETYADQIAGELAAQDTSLGRQVDARSFRALSQRVQAALRRPDDRAAPVVRERRDPVTDAVVGALLDFPDLLDDEDVTAKLASLDGDAVFFVSALKAARDAGEAAEISGENLENFLASVPPSFHGFASRRLAAPVHEDVATARADLFANAEKLHVRSMSRDHAALAEDMARAQARGDDDEAFALLRAAQESARRKRGLA